MSDWNNNYQDSEWNDDFRYYQESQRGNQKKGSKISKGAKIAGGILAGLGVAALSGALGIGNHDTDSYNDDGWES